MYVDIPTPFDTIKVLTFLRLTNELGLLLELKQLLI